MRQSSKEGHTRRMRTYEAYDMCEMRDAYKTYDAKREYGTR
jgi:ribosomal protein S21